LPTNKKDIPASDDKGDERTDVWHGVEYRIEKTLQTLSTVKHRFDNCGGIRHPSIIITTEPLRKAFLDVKNIGIKTRFITEITKDNLHYCKKLMQVVSEVRHLEGVKGNFAVTNTQYVSYAISEEVRPSLIEVVRSTSQVFIEQQQFFLKLYGIEQYLQRKG
jgi:two-component system, OmpR family, sensor histidine kinase VicK